MGFIDDLARGVREARPPRAQLEATVALARHLESEARDFTQEKRRKLAKQGKAMPDGSFPIEIPADVDSAVRLARTPQQRAHVKKRAKALGVGNKIPEGWG